MAAGITGIGSLIKLKFTLKLKSLLPGKVTSISLPRQSAVGLVSSVAKASPICLPSPRGLLLCRLNIILLWIELSKTRKSLYSFCETTYRILVTAAAVTEKQIITRNIITPIT